MYAELYRDSVGIEIKIKNLMITYLCDPDYCIYTEKQNEKPKDADTTNIRSAGFHIHVGYDNPEVDRSLRLLFYLDAYLGLPSILIDKDVQRRTLYGKAGCFRLTDYGKLN